MTAGPKTPRLCLVSDRVRLCAAAGQPLSSAAQLLEAQVSAAAEAGVECYQLRERDLEAGALLQLAERLKLAGGPALRLLVNERADVAVAAGLSLHLRASSMPAARLREWLPLGTWLMRAVHDVAAAAGAGPVDALIAGTMFATPSKSAGHPTLGVTGFAAVVAAAAVPVFAIGGMSASRWPEVRAAGAAGFASIGWFLPKLSETPQEAVRRAMREIAAVVDSTPEVS